MAYTLRDFSELKTKLAANLIDPDGEPLSCQLYLCDHPAGAISILDEAGEQIDYHIADACNIAGVIGSIQRILSVARSSIACAELSEVLILRLDVLREYIKAAIIGRQQGNYTASNEDLLIARWAGFLKHPSDFVFAHRCLGHHAATLSEDPCVIDNAFLLQWDGLSGPDKDRKKRDMANKIVVTQLPTIAEIANFFTSSAQHLNRYIAQSNCPSS